MLLAFEVAPLFRTGEPAEYTKRCLLKCLENSFFLIWLIVPMHGASLISNRQKFLSLCCGIGREKTRVFSQDYGVYNRFPHHLHIAFQK